MMTVSDNTVITIQNQKKLSSLEISQKIDIADYIPSCWRKYRIW